MVLEEIDFIEAIYWFENIGGFDVILPFLLIFTLIFALLDKVQLFGDNKKNVHLIISLVSALFVVSQPDLIFLIQGFIPRVAMFILVILMGLLVMGMFGLSGDKFTGWPLGVAVIVSVIAILWSLSAATDAFHWPLQEILTQQDIGWMISLGVFILVIWLIVKEPSDEEDKKDNKALHRLFGRTSGGR